MYIKVLVLFLALPAFKMSPSQLCNFDLASSTLRWVKKQCVFVFNNQTETKFIGREFQLTDTTPTKEAFQFIEADFNKFLKSPLTNWNHSCDCTKVPCLNEKQWNDLFAYRIEKARKDAAERWPFLARLCCSMQKVVVEIIYSLHEKDVHNLAKITSSNINIHNWVVNLSYELQNTKWCLDFKEKCDSFIHQIAKGCETKKRRRRKDIGLKPRAACQSSSCYQDAKEAPSSLLALDLSETSLQIFASTPGQPLTRMLTKTAPEKITQVDALISQSEDSIGKPTHLWVATSFSLRMTELRPSTSILSYVTLPMDTGKQVIKKTASIVMLAASRDKKKAGSILTSTTNFSQQRTHFVQEDYHLTSTKLLSSPTLKLLSPLSSKVMSSSLSISSPSSSSELQSLFSSPILPPFPHIVPILLTSSPLLYRFSESMSSQTSNSSTTSSLSLEKSGARSNHTFYVNTKFITSSRTLPTSEVTSNQIPTLVIFSETVLVRFNGNCISITNIESFKLRCGTTLSDRLQLPRADVIVDDVICGSVEVIFTIRSTFEKNITDELWKMINNASLVIEYDGKRYEAFDLRIISKPRSVMTRHPTVASTPTSISNHERKKLVFIVFLLFCSIFAALFVFFLVIFLSRFCACCQKSGKSRMHRKIRVREGDFELKRLSMRSEQILGVNYYGELVHSDENNPREADIFEEDIDDYYEDEFMEELHGDTARSLLNSNNDKDGNELQQQRFGFDDEDSCSSVVFY